MSDLPLTTLIERAANIIDQEVDGRGDFVLRLRAAAKKLRSAWDEFLEKYDTLGELHDLESLSHKAGAAGYHLRFDSPFQPGDQHQVGLTPHGVTGWNGRPDHYFNGTMEEAIEKASGFLDYVAARERPPEIRISEDELSADDEP